MFVSTHCVTCILCNIALACCRLCLCPVLRSDCWAQRAEERPCFDEVVGRLRRLLAEAPGS